MDELEDIKWLCNQYLNENTYFHDITRSIQMLLGLIKGISMDGHINDEEIKFLDNWVSKYSFLKNCWPYDELDNLLTKILSDKIITDDERNELIQFINSLDTGKKDNKDILDAVNRNYTQIDPLITIPDKKFCVTGVSKKYKRREIVEKIELYGGYVINTVSQTHDYLVICDDKNTTWAFTCYGRKVDTAMRYRKMGFNIAIVNAIDLFDAFENYS